MSQTSVYFTVLFGVSILALMPGLVIPSYFYADKILHLLICVLLLIWAFFLFESYKSILLITGLLMVGSLGVEAVQSTIPGRSSSLEDTMANLAGLSLGWIIGVILKTLWGSKNSE